MFALIERAGEACHGCPRARAGCPVRTRLAAVTTDLAYGRHAKAEAACHTACDIGLGCWRGCPAAHHLRAAEAEMAHILADRQLARERMPAAVPRWTEVLYHHTPWR